MYNVVQPFVNLTNANIETFSRFANSREINDLAKSSASKYWDVVQENLSKVAESDAFAQWTRAMIDNYVRFANEYAKNMYSIVSQGQEFVSQQVEEGSKRFQRIADITGRTVEAGADALKSATDEVSNEADQQLARARQHRGK
jgi:hypothetical protein